MNRTLLAAALAALALPAAAEDFNWQGALAAGKSVEIKGVNGAIQAVAASGSEVRVSAEKRGRRSDPGSVRIEVVEHAAGVTVCAVYPSSGGRDNVCAPGDGGHMSTRDNDVNVHFRVEVPRGVHLVARTVNGEIQVDDLGGNVDAETVNGSIDVSAAGHALAQTVNGSIRARMGRVDWTEPAEFQTVNGSITLEMPAGTGAEVRAETVNGEIVTDFPMTVTGRVSKRRLSGKIGDGGRPLKLETVNGSIHLRQAR